MKGVIVLWSGAIVDIPDGWVICDGNNGTPNLALRFVIGAGGMLAPGATGGATSHTHDFTSDGHDHTFPAGLGLAAGADKDVKTTISVATGTTDSESHVPSFYALAYIMKT